MADTPDIQGLSTPSGSTPNIQGPSFEDTSLEQRQSLIDAHKRNVSLALLAAGLATLGAQGERGRRPSLGQALGQGGLAGLGMYEQGERATALEELKRQQVAGQEQYRNTLADLTNQRIQETHRHNVALEQQKDADIKPVGTYWTDQYKNTPFAAMMPDRETSKNWTTKQVRDFQSKLATEGPKYMLDLARTRAEVARDAVETAKTSQELKDLNPLPQEAVKSYLKLALPKEDITPGTIAFFGAMPAKEMRETLNSIISIKKGGTDVKLGEPILQEDGTWHQQLITVDKTSGAVSTTVLPGAVAPKGAGKQMSPEQMDVQAQKDAETAWKNAKGGFSGLQGYVVVNGQKLDHDTFVNSYKTKRLHEMQGATSGGSSKSKPVYSITLKNGKTVNATLGDDGKYHPVAGD